VVNGLGIFHIKAPSVFGSPVTRQIYSEKGLLTTIFQKCVHRELCLDFRAWRRMWI